ncbi:MAG: M15 family metallopeptidase [Actinomycetota bacterium]|nr:M15 family metallopeptidase [Actinomycetota bacterium]
MNRWTAWGAVPLALLLLVACSGSPGDPEPAAEPAPTGPTATTPAPTAAAPAPSTSSTIPAFSGVAVRVTAADLPASWRPGCPVDPSDLRRLELSYWGFDDRHHTGALIVHASEAEKIISVFRRLYDRRFPIRRMEPIDAYGGSDDASIAADNTAGFNCRNAVASGPPQWSAHAFGRAIDVNPVENPYVLEGDVLPPAGREFLDRRNVRPGMAVRGGELVAAFAEVGWSWGGVWANPDYQHFSASGS